QLAGQRLTAAASRTPGKWVPSGMEAERRRRSDDRERAAYDGSSPASAAVLGSTTDCLTPPKLDGQGGDRELALAMKPERAVRTAWPDRAAGRTTGGYCERSDRGGGGRGGGRNARAVSPTLPLEGLHKMEGCFVTPKKISGHVLLGNRGEGGGGARRMGVSPSDHEPVRIAPMVRHNRSDDDDNNNNNHCGYDNGGTLYDEDSSGAATSMHTRTAARQHENDCAYPLGFSSTETSPVDRGDRRTGSTGATAVVDDFSRKQTESSRFVVGRSSERMSVAESMGRGGGGEKLGASKGQAAAGGGPPWLDGVAAAGHDAAEMLTVEHDEWKEARTAEGKIYYYNRRTRVPRWTLPPTATYVPDPSRPAGYRIFALAATMNINVGDKSTAPASAASGSERTSGGVIDHLLRGPGGAGAGGAQEANSSRERFGRDNSGGGGATLSNAPTLSEVTPMTTKDLESPAASSPTTAATAGDPTTPATASARVKDGAGTTGFGDGGAATTPKRRFVVHKSGVRSPSLLSAATAAAAASAVASAAAAAAATPSTLPETSTTATTDDADDQKNDARNRRCHLPRESTPPPAAAAARSPRDKDGTVETLTATKSAYSVSASPAPPAGCFSADDTASLVERTHDDDKHPERPVSPTAPRLSCCVGHEMSAPATAGGGAGFQGRAASPGAGGSTGGQAAAVGGRGLTVGEGKAVRRQVEEGVEVGSTCLTEVLPDEPAAVTTRATAAAAVREGEEFEAEAQLTADSPTATGAGGVEADKELEMEAEAAMATGQQGLSSQSGGAGQRKEDQRYRVGGGGSPSSQTSSSASVTDFVHYVRVQSGGRGGASLSPPASRSNRTRGGGQGAGALRSSDSLMSKDKEAISSEGIPGTFHRRPLGPVRRSEEMEHLLSSRSKPQENHPYQGPEEPAADTALWATAAETPTTALAGVPVYQTHHHHHPSSRSRRSAQADTVRYSGSGVGGGKTGVCDAKGGSSGGRGLLPGSSVLRHRVRRQLFSEDSEARPLVFCPFCGEGVVRAGGLRDHLQECYVLDRCRGSETHKQVEVAIRAVSVENQMHTNTTDTHGKGASSLNDDSFQDSSTLLQHTLPPFVWKGNGPENVLAPAVASENSELGGVVATGGGRGAAGGKVSGVGSEVSLGGGGAGGGGGAEVERCEDCGRTFAPGRLRSHAKACRSVFLERRRPYDPKAMRARGTPLEFFQQPIGAASCDDNPSNPPTSGKGGDGGGTATSRRGVGRNKPSLVGGSSGRREGSSQSGDADRVSPGGLDISVGTGGGSLITVGGEVGGSFLRKSRKVALKTLPAVEGRYDESLQ
ncbi:unnamed protein product, partial [Ectocarpus sp. 4 AP-2014]